jgi:hypothetical protein
MTSSNSEWRPLEKLMKRHRYQKCVPCGRVLGKLIDLGIHHLKKTWTPGHAPGNHSFGKPEAQTH